MIGWHDSMHTPVLTCDECGKVADVHLRREATLASAMDATGWSPLRAGRPHMCPRCYAATPGMRLVDWATALEVVP